MIKKMYILYCFIFLYNGQIEPIGPKKSLNDFLKSSIIIAGTNIVSMALSKKIFKDDGNKMQAKLEKNRFALQIFIKIIISEIIRNNKRLIDPINLNSQVIAKGLRSVIFSNLIWYFIPLQKWLFIFLQKRESYYMGSLFINWILQSFYLKMENLIIYRRLGVSN